MKGTADNTGKENITEAHIHKKSFWPAWNWVYVM